MEKVSQKQKKAYEAMKENWGYENPMESPKMAKVVLSTGIGSIKDKQKMELIPERLSRITGQKPSPRPAKKSIASFKTRQGDIIGYQVTLRGPRMHQFLDKFLNVALPRTRDFRGVKPEAVDEMGNLTIGIKEHTIFPETTDEELKNVFGLSITLVSSASTKEEALEFFKTIGIPFRKENPEE